MRCTTHLAFFRAPAIKLDHFAHEATCWNDIRDWGDHFASHHVEIVWGAGRHGAGNNLFIFVRDPDENNVEISAELKPSLLIKNRGIGPITTGP